MAIKRGQTIVAEREKTESESERLKIRQKETMRARMTAATFIVAVAAVLVMILALGHFIWSRVKPVEEEPKVTYTPTVEVIDERGDGYAEKSEKVRNYVGLIEQDFQDAGYKVAKVVLPANKLREVDVYLEGRGEYYKCQLDRGTAETVEDVARMIRYLDSNGVSPTYVDVRIEGKAYYL